MADPFLDALAAVRGQSADQASDPFLSALNDVRKQAPDSRSWFARGVDALSEPLLPQIASGARRLANWMSAPRLGEAELNERIPGAGTAAAMIRGGVAGAVEGAGDVAASFSSPLGLAAWLSGVGAERAGVQGLVRAAKALRGVEAASGAAFGARGLEQAVSAPTLPEKALGVAQAAGGTLGMRGGVRGFLRSAAPAEQPVIGYLRSGPSFVANESGTVARPGETIPMTQAPDGSYVRSVPAEYARREPRGALPPGPRFIAPEAGPVADRAAGQPDPFVAARRDVRTAPGPDVSRVEAVPAAIADREFEGSKTTRTIYSGDPNAVDAPKVQLTVDEARELRRMAAELEHLPYTPRTWNWLSDEVGKRGNAAGGAAEIVAGAAGAPVYSDIIRPLSYRPTRGQVLHSVQDFLEGRHSGIGQEALEVARLRLAGDPSVSRPMLPPDAGEPLSVRDYAQALTDEGEKPIADVPFALQPDAAATRAHQPSMLGSGLAVSEAEPRSGGGVPREDHGFDAFMRAVDDLSALPGGGEPGEAGFIRPELAARLGLGGAGAAYGAATGEDTTDRLKRAAIFGAAGFAAPSLLAEGPARGFIRTGGRITQAADQRGPIPRAEPIPADRLHSMPTLTPEVQGAADALLERYGGFERQRRGVQSVERTNALADRVEVPTDRPLTAGTALNAERLRAYQNATATILQKQRQLEQLVKAKQATPAQVLELEQARSEAEVLTSSFRGAAAEAGRALHILRYQARILASGDPEAIREAVTASNRGVAGQARSYFYANILSGLGTHEKNILGNVGNAVYGLAAHPFAVGADVARSAATHQPRSVFIGELPEKVAGTVAALPRAFSNFLYTLKTGLPNTEVTTFDRPIHPEFRGGGANPFNWPGRALEAVDDFFSTVAAQQTQYGAAFAQAKREGLKGSAFLARVADLKVNPSDEVMQEVASQRARLLFREKPGAIAQAVLAAKRHLPAIDYVVPFVRVPANIIHQGFQASPVGFALPAARQGGRAGADAMGRAALGSLVLAPLAYWAAAGKITGDAPREAAERAAFYESGKRPNSILIGDKWYNYQSIQPLNVPLALIANGFQTWREAKGDSSQTGDQIAIDTALRTAGSLLDQSFLSGLSALVDALSDPERKGRAFVQQFVSGFVPFSGALRTVTQATDPYIRAPKSVVEGVKSNLPGLSETLPPRLTRFGEPVERGAGAFNVFKPSQAVNDPIADALAAADVNLRPAQGPKDLVVGRGVRIPLSGPDQFAVGQATGRGVRQALERVVASPEFQQMPPAMQRRILEQVISQARAGVRQQATREALLQQMQGR